MHLHNNIFNILYAAAFCAVVNSARLSIIDSHIIGGNEASIEQYPYQVALSQLASFCCGASLVGPRHIVTAAHCFFLSSSFIEFEVRVGSSHRYELGNQVGIDYARRHPNYRMGRVDYDVAVAQLDETIEFGPTIQPIPLVPMNEEPKPGDLVTASGWGRIGTSEKPGADQTNILRAVSVPIISREDCRGQKIITSNMICTGSPGKTVYKGDSGGPLVNAKKQLVGIVSFSNGKDVLTAPAVYCNTASPDIHEFITANADI